VVMRVLPGANQRAAGRASTVLERSCEVHDAFVAASGEEAVFRLTINPATKRLMEAATTPDEFAVVQTLLLREDAERARLSAAAADRGCDVGGAGRTSYPFLPSGMHVKNEKNKAVELVLKTGSDGKLINPERADRGIGALVAAFPHRCRWVLVEKADRPADDVDEVDVTREVNMALAAYNELVELRTELGWQCAVPLPFGKSVMWSGSRKTCLWLTDPLLPLLRF
jgi:hypothetical protein